MHLRSITCKGFKSFPDRLTLEFGSGVSVIVGPNGSGKSNITDAVLWAMGEQSPLAVRGQAMQDVIFGGGRGRQATQAAEVELVLDNADATLEIGLTEISIHRRLDRSGEGEYRLNGARCRLVDVLELLSDTGLGKESHSVVSQGRVEAMVTSKPRDRRLLIEEAAGLGKHRKRRRRAQLKLQRARENLDRALDVEREARSRLRPLKRQAEAAELHERLERQSVEARWTLARDDVRARRRDLAAAESAVAAARGERTAVEAALAEVAARREAAEQALAARGEQREALARRAFGARGAAERIAFRAEQARSIATEVAERAARERATLRRFEAEAGEDSADDGVAERIAALEAELTALDHGVQERIERELEALEERRADAAGAVARAETALTGRVAALGAADEVTGAARSGLRAAEAEVERSRREAARVGAELAAVNHGLRLHAAGAGAVRALAGELQVTPGYERALAAALGGRLGAAIVPDLAAGEAALDRGGRDGGWALVVDPGDGDGGGDGVRSGDRPPVPGAERLLDHVAGPADARAVAARLLGDAWLVGALEQVPSGFRGIAVTTGGRVLFGASGELRQVPQGGEERILTERNRREALIAHSAAAAGAERVAAAAVDAASGAVAAAEAAREEADVARRAAGRDRDLAQEEARRVAWLLDQRRAAPAAGPEAERRGRLEAELGAERRLAERAERERRERDRRVARGRRRLAADEALAPAAEVLADRLAGAAAAVGERVEAFEADLAADRATGERLAAELRGCAGEEAEVQSRLKARGEAVTAAEVRAQQVRDHAADAEAELVSLGDRLGLPPEPAAVALPTDERAQLASRIERLARRREQLGPVNPLAQDEYAEELAHVEELERQRTDLETALRELQGVIRDTDRQIRETFEETFAVTAQHFEELIGALFPGGRGRLRLVREDLGPRAVLGGEPPPGEPAAGLGTAGEEAAAEAEEREDEDLLGVEIEVTPAGKAMKRLSLLSGGEKSMTALAFLFAVFLARPCPFYILDEVEAALDDLNIDRFLDLLRRHADRAQFIVVTHQKRTMEAADTLYGVSMGDDGVSKVISRRLPPHAATEPPSAAAGAA